MSPATPTTYDPYDPAVQDDPYRVYGWLRDHAPAFWNAERRFSKATRSLTGTPSIWAIIWTLSRFDDVWMAVHDHERFSSAGGDHGRPGPHQRSDFVGLADHDHA